MGSHYVPGALPSTNDVSRVLVSVQRKDGVTFNLAVVGVDLFVRVDYTVHLMPYHGVCREIIMLSFIDAKLDS